MAVFRSDTLRRWSGRLLSFFLGQGAMQALNLITGFLLVRWMTKETYAQYSVAFGFQSTVGVLVDLGFSGSIVALVGSRGGDPAVVGAFIRSAKHYRRLLFATVVPVAAVVFWWMAGRQGWDHTTRALLFGSVVVALWVQGWAAYYGAPLLIHHRLGAFYRAQIESAAARLGGSLFLQWIGRLNAVTSAWLSCLSLLLCAWFYQRSATPYVQEPARPDPAANREMTRFLAPVIPGTIFYALQGQLTLFLITFFGRSQNIAEVAALGRLTQVLIMLGAFNGVVIEPYVARLHHSQLPRRYPLLLGGGILVAAALALFAFAFPGPLLWLIGEKYAHLQHEFSWSILAWGLNYIGGLMWLMHAARKWVFWWHTALTCTLLTLSQFLGVWWFDLSTTLGIFQFSMLTGAANILAHTAGGIFGYWNETRRHPEPPDTSAPMATVPVGATEPVG